jgi:hypothetical protein
MEGWDRWGRLKTSDAQKGRDERCVSSQALSWRHSTRG